MLTKKSYYVSYYTDDAFDRSLYLSDCVVKGVIKKGKTLNYYLALWPFYNLFLPILSLSWSINKRRRPGKTKMSWKHKIINGQIVIMIIMTFRGARSWDFAVTINPLEQIGIKQHIRIMLQVTLPLTLNSTAILWPSIIC